MTPLCEGTVNTANQIRRLAWDAADRASSSPEMSVTSLHQVTAASTVTSHRLEVPAQDTRCQSGAGPSPAAQRATVRGG